MPTVGELRADKFQRASTEPVSATDLRVRVLAREYTGRNIPEGKLMFGSNDPDSPLNPCGRHFDARSWAINVAALAQEGGQSFRQVGLCFQDVNVFGYGTLADFQKDVGNIWLTLPSIAHRLFARKAAQIKTDILRRFNGIIRPGEMCIVLGPPGSGCSTFLKTISGDTNGLHVGQSSYFNYQGISTKDMHTAHRGDCIYTAEVDVHFPMLTVGETLSFASRARCRQELPHGISRAEYVIQAIHSSS